jgi:hypothetical protein
MKIQPVNQPPAGAEQMPSDQSTSESRPASTTMRQDREAASNNGAWLFIAGFFGWYLIATLISRYMNPIAIPPESSRNQELMICYGTYALIANGIVLGLLLKFARLVGYGMLAALAVNLLLSLAGGLYTNSFCFIPFLSPVR